MLSAHLLVHVRDDNTLERAREEEVKDYRSAALPCGRVYKNSWCYSSIYRWISAEPIIVAIHN